MSRYKWAEAHQLEGASDFIINVAGLPCKITSVEYRDDRYCFTGENPGMPGCNMISTVHLISWYTVELWDTYEEYLKDQPHNQIISSSKRGW